jgi:hypothetical protein
VPFTPHRDAATRGATWALVLGIVGSVVGLAIGWGFPLSIASLVLAVPARRVPGSSRTVATWSIGLVVLSGFASVAWLIYSIISLVG